MSTRERPTRSDSDRREGVSGLRRPRSSTSRSPSVQHAGRRRGQTFGVGRTGSGHASRSKVVQGFVREFRISDLTSGSGAYGTRTLRARTRDSVGRPGKRESSDRPGIKGALSLELVRVDPHSAEHLARMNERRLELAKVDRSRLGGRPRKVPAVVVDM